MDSSSSSSSMSLNGNVYWFITELMIEYINFKTPPGQITIPNSGTCTVFHFALPSRIPKLGQSLLQVGRDPREQSETKTDRGESEHNMAPE